MTSKAAMSGAKYCVTAPHRPANGRPVIRIETARARTGCPEALGFRDLHQIHDNLSIKLRWYGWPSAKIGPFRPQGSKVLVDVLAEGRVTCRITADRRTGAVQLAAGTLPAALCRGIGSSSLADFRAVSALPDRLVSNSSPLRRPPPLGPG